MRFAPVGTPGHTGEAVRPPSQGVRMKPRDGNLSREAGTATWPVRPAKAGPGRAGLGQLCSEGSARHHALALLQDGALTSGHSGVLPRDQGIHSQITQLTAEGKITHGKGLDPRNSWGKSRELHA